MPEHPIDPASLVDIARYPLDNPQDDRYRNTLSLIRAQLAQDGRAVIPGFLSSRGLSHLLNEAQERRELAYFSANKKTNVYFSCSGREKTNLPVPVSIAILWHELGAWNFKRKVV